MSTTSRGPLGLPELKKLLGILSKVIVEPSFVLNFSRNLATIVPNRYKRRFLLKRPTTLTRICMTKIGSSSKYLETVFSVFIGNLYRVPPAGNVISYAVRRSLV